MKTINLFFISLLIFSNTFSQSPKSGSTTDSIAITSPQTGIHNNNLPSDKLHLSFETGVSFYSFNKQSSFDKWFAPSLTYDLTSKFHLTVGSIAMFSKPDFQYSLNSEGIKTTPQNTGNGQYFLFAHGAYQLSNRITFTGSILKEVPTGTINPNALSINHVGVDFKVSDAFTISAGCTVAKGYNSSLIRNSSGFNIPSSAISGGFNNSPW
jgi:hypothetical protein